MKYLFISDVNDLQSQLSIFLSLGILTRLRLAFRHLQIENRCFRYLTYLTVSSMVTLPSSGW